MEPLPHIYELDLDAIVDVYVGYDLNIAIKSFEHELYPVTIFYCAIALEEQLCAIYEFKTNPNTNKFDGKELKYMNLHNLIKWAENEKIFKTEFKILNEIRLARNYFGHAVRIMGPKTKEMIKNGKLDSVIPNKMDYPEWFKSVQKYNETVTEDGIDPSEPAIGWLDSSDTAKRIYCETIHFVLETGGLIGLDNEKYNHIKGR